MIYETVKLGSLFSIKQPELVKTKESLLPPCLQEIAKVVHQFWLYVCAYFGSKDGNFISRLCNRVVSWIKTGKPQALGPNEALGYERFVRRRLNKNELHQCAAICAMTAFMRNHSFQYIEPIGIRLVDIHSRLDPKSLKQLSSLGFEIKNGAIFHVKNCVKMSLLQSASGKYYLGYGDAGALERFTAEHGLEEKSAGMEMRARGIVAQELLVGKINFLEHTSQATSIILESLQLAPSQVALFGQCYGGLLASYTSIDLGYKCVTINSMSLGAHAQVHLGEKLSKAKELVTHVFVESDLTQSHPVVEGLDWFFSRIGFRTPGCFGKKFEIKNVHNFDLVNRHAYSFDLVLGNLGYPTRYKFEDMSEEERAVIQNSGFDAFTELE